MSWIKCSERLPEVSKKVLLCVRGITSGASVEAGWLRDLRFHKNKNVGPWHGEYGVIPERMVTHWHEMPEPPKDGE